MCTESNDDEPSLLILAICFIDICGFNCPRILDGRIWHRHLNNKVIITVVQIKQQELYSQHFIFVVTDEWTK
jgi:hypothetical protein